MKIITNYHWREILSGFDLTAAERAENDFLDWSAEDSDGFNSTFFRYRGWCYYLGNIERVYPGSDLEALGWHGFSADSAWSGVVVRLSDDGDRLIAGRAYS